MSACTGGKGGRGRGRDATCFSHLSVRPLRHCQETLDECLGRGLFSLPAGGALETYAKEVRHCGMDEKRRRQGGGARRILWSASHSLPSAASFL